MNFCDLCVRKIGKVFVFVFVRSHFMESKKWIIYKKKTQQQTIGGHGFLHLVITDSLFDVLCTDATGTSSTSHSHAATSLLLLTLSNRYSENSNLNLKFGVVLCNASWKSYATNKDFFLTLVLIRILHWFFFVLLCKAIQKSHAKN